MGVFFTKTLRFQKPIVCCSKCHQTIQNIVCSKSLDYLLIEMKALMRRIFLLVVIFLSDLAPEKRTS